MRNRIIRDFTRLGIGTAVLIAIYGSDSQGQQPSASTRPTGPVYSSIPPRTRCSRLDRPGRTSMHRSTVRGRARPQRDSPASHASPLGSQSRRHCLGITVLAARAVFGIFHGLGRVIAGFGRD